MKVFYAARVARFDLLRCIGHLARYVTKWSRTCDEKLFQMMCYVKCTLGHKMTGWIGDPIESLNVHLYTDADYGGSQNKSTSGVHLSIEGPNSNFMIAALSSLMTAVSHSTPEAELVAGDFGIRKEGIAALVMWETLKPKVLHDSVSCGNPVAAAASKAKPSKTTSQRVRKEAGT